METNNYSTLYNDTDKQILKQAEDSLDPKLDRVDEIIRYAKEAEINKIGIANCTTFNKEANQLEVTLSDAGFQVEKVHCKYGRVPFNDLIPGYTGISCNPAGQAQYLEDKGTELNIMMGLCLGHDMIFNARSKAPVTPLLVKDRKLKHNTLRLFKDSDTFSQNNE
ncbi:MAG: DUF1847 domain-containing protein [Bacteroidales bacterium]|nr:DUF1847 domain-containing protein [Bacteroidales bacterium]MBK8881600.1 DUF1847 domain-containing protein [Bacteroidales bacterium]